MHKKKISELLNSKSIMYEVSQVVIAYVEVATR